MKPYSVDLGKWTQFPKETQLLHIKAELSRATNAGLRGDRELEDGAYYRAIALLDATIVNRTSDEASRLRRYRDAVAALLGRGEYVAVSRVLMESIV
ncbi:MAG: hypothetical protein COV07_03585 [Candidatus Vogelbacteria bacterium CG10_big_fil_rev_8_21_14_0_10_45_14]|uniref:Uncharacterized protein n=1 Tax=Candidatus Vogelbacteria bacterium CG10_big_fil_rev_8_21_14_0_10_45_14 TaxID=1975042 RepID=A0A2H0RJD9_9BACT|nr:MAG: hypothetical protein COV07_03585 [Candidatus Vogelbacteria bacterium CG10_big_fil_rev_8_21_14_0_10_45_14]